MNDSGAHAHTIEVPCERFNNSSGRRLHMNFPGAAKCADRSDVSKDSVHGELEAKVHAGEREYRSRNPATCRKNNLTFPIPNGQN